MPTSMFLRLPAEKQARICQAAWEEFLSVRLSQASINRIIQKAHIPRGSFYQYFADKEDLFFYLLSDIRANCDRWVGQLLIAAEGDMFQCALLVFDNAREQPAPTLRKLLQLMRLNPSLDLLQFITLPPRCLPAGIQQQLDLRQYRRQDNPFLVPLFSLLSGATVAALVQLYTNPERRSELRTDLCIAIDILKYGALSPVSLTQKEEANLDS